MLAQGDLVSVVLAFFLTTLAVSTRFGRDLLSMPDGGVELAFEAAGLRCHIDVPIGRPGGIGQRDELQARWLGSSSDPNRKGALGFPTA